MGGIGGGEGGGGEGGGEGGGMGGGGGAHGGGAGGWMLTVAAATAEAGTPADDAATVARLDEVSVPLACPSSVGAPRIVFCTVAVIAGTVDAMSEVEILSAAASVESSMVVDSDEPAGALRVTS